MTHAALIAGVVLVFLVVMVLLLVSYIMAVIVSPQRPGSDRPQQHQAGFHGWAAGAEATGPGDQEVMTPDPVPRPEASGRPLWRQAPEPPGLDG